MPLPYRPPARWWPGSSYVNWVGIDGYYYQPSWKFASLFGPTIKAVRALTLDPILISETAAPGATQPAKIADLFAGIRAYGLLGFVWFDANKGAGLAHQQPGGIRRVPPRRRDIEAICVMTIELRDPSRSSRIRISIIDCRQSA